MYPRHSARQGNVTDSLQWSGYLTVKLLGSASTTTSMRRNESSAPKTPPPTPSASGRKTSYATESEVQFGRLGGSTAAAVGSTRRANRAVTHASPVSFSFEGPAALTRVYTPPSSMVILLHPASKTPVCVIMVPSLVQLKCKVTSTAARGRRGTRPPGQYAGAIEGGDGATRTEPWALIHGSPE